MNLTCLKSGVVQAELRDPKNLRYFIERLLRDRINHVRELLYRNTGDLSIW